MPTIPSSGAAIPASAADVPTSAATMPTSGASIPGTGAGGGAADAFVTKCMDSGKLFGLWSARDITAGSVSDGGTVMEDLSGNSRPALVAVMGSAGNWKITEDSDAPDPAIDSLKRYIEIDGGNQGTTDYAAMASAFGAVPVTASKPFSGFVVYYAPSITSTKAEILSLTGTAATPAGTADALSLWNQNIWYGPNAAFGYTDTTTGLTAAQTTNDDRSGTWWFMAFRAEDTDDDDDVDDITVYIQDLGSAWATDQTTLTLSNTGLFATKCVTETGIRIAYASGAGLAADYRYAAIALFTDDIGIGASGSTLRTIFEEIA